MTTYLQVNFGLNKDKSAKHLSKESFIQMKVNVIYSYTCQKCGFSCLDIISCCLFFLSNKYPCELAEPLIIPHPPILDFQKKTNPKNVQVYVRCHYVWSMMVFLWKRSMVFFGPWYFCEKGLTTSNIHLLKLTSVVRMLFSFLWSRSISDIPEISIFSLN